MGAVTNYRGHTIEFRENHGPFGRHYEVQKGGGHVCWKEDPAAAMALIDELSEFGPSMSEDQAHFERIARRHIGQFSADGFYGTGGIWVYRHNFVQNNWLIWQDRTAGR